MGYYPFYAVFDAPDDPARLQLQMPEPSSAWSLDLVNTDLVSGRLHDFDNEVYDADGPTAEQAAERLAIAVAVVRGLVCAGARLAWISGAADNFAGEPDHPDTAAGLQAAIRDPAMVASLLARPLYFWLIACPADSALAALVAGRGRSRLLAERPAMIIEERESGPLFTEALTP